MCACVKWSGVIWRVASCVDPYGEHAAAGQVFDAVDLDHIRSRHVAPELAYVVDNCRPLCKRCHGRISRSVARGASTSSETAGHEALRYNVFRTQGVLGQK